MALVVKIERELAETALDSNGAISGIVGGRFSVVISATVNGANRKRELRRGVEEVVSVPLRLNRVILKALRAGFVFSAPDRVDLPRPVLSRPITDRLRGLESCSAWPSRPSRRGTHSSRSDSRSLSPYPQLTFLTRTCSAITISLPYITSTNPTLPNPPFSSRWPTRRAHYARPGPPRRADRPHHRPPA